MFKSKTLSLFIALWIVVSFLTGCQSSSDDESPAKPTATPAATVDPRALTETYTSPTGVSFQHPTGWIVRYQPGFVTATNNLEAFSATTAQPGQVAFMLMEPSFAAVNGGATPAEVLTLYAAQEQQMTFGPILSAEISDQVAARATISQDQLEGFALAIEMQPHENVLLIALAAPGEIAAFEPLLLDIAATIRYIPPA